MGCNCSRDEGRIVKSRYIPRNNFVIKIHIPNSEKVKVLILENNSEFILLSDLINRTLYCGSQSEELDANFISIYDKEKDEFKYYIQRLAGIEMENDEEPNQGKIWVPYINKQIQNWTQLCRENRIIKKDEELELKYENFNE